MIVGFDDVNHVRLKFPFFRKYGLRHYVALSSSFMYYGFKQDFYVEAMLVHTTCGIYRPCFQQSVSGFLCGHAIPILPTNRLEYIP